MGFIDYNGTKEDRYTEVLEYARAQQEEDWKRKEEQKIVLWLRNLVGTSSFARLNLEDLIKYIIVKYRTMHKAWKELVRLMKIEQGIDQNHLWEDFSLDLAARHLSLFHLTAEKRNKYLDVFQTKIFKVENPISAKDHYKRMEKDPIYRQYYAECFDPAWKGRQVFKWLWTGVEKNKDGEKLIDEFIDADIQLSLFLGLYLHQVIMPHNDAWMHEIESERRALSDIRYKIHRGSMVAPDLETIVNPLYKAQTSAKASESTDEKDNTNSVVATTVAEGDAETIPKSGLDKIRFITLIQNRNISDYVSASKLLLDCDLPDNIAQIYRQLIERMPVLQDAIRRFDEIYHADIDQFEEYYAPEALRITSIYLDYQAVKPSEKILRETRENVYMATRKLLQVVNEKIDEIYRFVTIDANAAAKALETLMSQDGHVDPAFRIK